MMDVCQGSKSAPTSVANYIADMAVWNHLMIIQKWERPFLSIPSNENKGIINLILRRALLIVFPIGIFFGVTLPGNLGSRVQ